MLNSSDELLAISLIPLSSESIQIDLPYFHQKIKNYLVNCIFFQPLMYHLCDFFSVLSFSEARDDLHDDQGKGQTKDDNKK